MRDHCVAAGHGRSLGTAVGAALLSAVGCGTVVAQDLTDLEWSTPLHGPDPSVDGCQLRWAVAAPDVTDMPRRYAEYSDWANALTATISIEVDLTLVATITANAPDAAAEALRLAPAKPRSRDAAWARARTRDADGAVEALPLPKEKSFEVGGATYHMSEDLGLRLPAGPPGAVLAAEIRAAHAACRPGDRP